MPYELHIRRGKFANTDPQRRCYNGAYASGEVKWEQWERWGISTTYDDRESAELAASLFRRGTQQLKVVKITRS